MNAKQKIFRLRRDYNQWVNNQTLEDYALRFTAKSARKWSLARVANTALGAISFLALEAIGGALTISYGFDNAAIATLIVGLMIFLAGIPICYYAAKYGVDIDLLTRGAGFGYIGSTATSLIYASFTFIFFALEAAIMAMALKLLFGIPLSIGYIICSIVIIPLVTYGITLISRLQLWTQPLWVLLQILPFAYLLLFDPNLTAGWTDFSGTQSEQNNSSRLIYIGTASAILFSLIAQVGEQVDFLRFFPEKNKDNNIRWWVALLAAGPGWIVIGVAKIFAGSLLAYIAFNSGLSASDASDPTQMYRIAFENFISNPQTALVISGIFVILSQLKINVTNAYAGSIAWSNFFSRLTHSHPGRVVWLIFNVAIALVLMEIGVYQAFESTLATYAIVAVSWVSCLVADLIINKPLKLSPKHIEFRRAYLYDINPVGLGSMIISSTIGIAFYLGLYGETAKALAHFITIISAFILVPVIAVLTQSRYYLARETDDKLFTEDTINCCICLNPYEKEDMAFCPAYDGPICSLCCSLDARCQDMCKIKEPMLEKMFFFFSRFLPSTLKVSPSSRVIKFGFMLTTISIVIGALLLLSYVNAKTSNTDVDSLIGTLLWQVYLILIIVAGVIAWLFVLANESRLVAQEESNRQNQLLKQEVQAHKKTDKELQHAKEHAEAANQAKSRYLTGISHELRSPLNSILGYAQLLETDRELLDSKRAKITLIKRSGEHLANLIEGLLDISQIEAGRLHINRDEVNIAQFLKQIVDMFQLQAEQKSLEFNYNCINPLPEYVATDEKRLRQILINLLSNAIKFTQAGRVSLSIKYKNQVAEFTIKDTGVGIPEKELERIFKPFERVTLPGTPATTGTGLGLTITHLLTEIMGGEIKVSSNQEEGTTFTVWLMLSDIINPEAEKTPAQTIYGYKGDRKTITVVDDDPNHRSLINDILSPLGFTLLEAHSVDSCLSLNQQFEPDLYLLDISMPNKSGWEAAQQLREKQYLKPIIIVSANANESIDSQYHSDLVNDHITKPINIDLLLEKIGLWLNIEWEHSEELGDNHLFSNNKQQATPPTKNIIEREINTLIELAEIGHLSEFKKKLSEIELSGKVDPNFTLKIQTWLQDIKFDEILRYLKND